MKKLLFATNNAHKLREAREILDSFVEVISLDEAGFSGEIPETQETLEGNARQKAWYIHERTGMDCFADDTGLEIGFLGGRPGVYSARYAGEQCSFEDNVRKVLQEMVDTDDRKAAFRCVVCLILDGKEHLFEGRIDGHIARERSGDGGFGYDPVFIPEGESLSFAEMEPEAKNRISHRGRAMIALAKFLHT